MNTDAQHTLLQKAGTHASHGRFSEARDCLKELLKDNPDFVDALGMLGNIEKTDQNFAAAIQAFQEIIAVQPENPWPYYDLGQVFELDKDFDQAVKSYLKAWKLDRKNARFALYAGYAFWQTGDHDQALQIWSIGSDQDPIVRTAHLIDRADSNTKLRSKLADQELRRHFTQLSASGMKQHGNPERLQSSVWPQTHFGEVRYSSNNQKPYMFYAPDLDQVPVFDRAHVPWAKALEDCTKSISEELRDYLQSRDNPGIPYVEHNDSLSEAWQKLNKKDGWNAVHLYKDAKAQDCLAQFPQTRKALENVPLVEMFGTPMEVFFSILKPDSHIPPHFGLSNSRCTAHLPLIVPTDCNIRVADHVHHWRPGELFLFDDSFDHEAINNNAEEIRIVLIMETWRPDLSEQEIQALQQTMEDRHSWLINRRIPDIEIN